MYLVSFGTCSGSSWTNDSTLSKITDVGMGFLFSLSLIVLVGVDSYLAAFGAAYLSVSFTVNILLTLMIIARLVLHSRNIRSATRAQTGAGGAMYKAIITMFVESPALYAASSLPVIGLWAVDSPVINTFFPIIAGTQVRVASMFSRCAEILGCNRLIVTGYRLLPPS